MIKIESYQIEGDNYSINNSFDQRKRKFNLSIKTKRVIEEISQKARMVEEEEKRKKRTNRSSHNIRVRSSTNHLESLFFQQRDI